MKNRIITQNTFILFCLSLFLSCSDEPINNMDETSNSLVDEIEMNLDVDLNELPVSYIDTDVIPQLQEELGANPSQLDIKVHHIYDNKRYTENEKPFVNRNVENDLIEKYSRSTSSVLKVTDYPYWMFFRDRYHNRININYGTSYNSWFFHKDKPGTRQERHPEAVFFKEEMIIVNRVHDSDNGILRINRTINQDINNIEYKTYSDNSDGKGVPSIIEFNNKLHMVWRGAQCVNGKCGGVYYSNSSDGYNWSPSVRIIDMCEYDPEITVFNNKLYCLVPQNDSNGRTGITAFSSSDGSTNWRGESRIMIRNGFVEVTAIVHNGNIILLTTSDKIAFALISADGRRWLGRGIGYETAGKIGAVVDGNNIFIAGSKDDGIIWTSYSSDGLSWSPASRISIKTDIHFSHTIALVKMP